MAFTHFHPPIPLPRWNVFSNNQRRKIHCYDCSSASNDFCLEATLDPFAFYMTSCKPGVKQGDRVRINDAHGLSEYRIDEIDFYSNPADMWIAKLQAV